MEIGKMLKEKRAEHELTQEELSEKIFISKKTISNWETGKTTPDLDSLIRLANLFDLSLDNLLLEGSTMVENINKKEKAFKVQRWGLLMLSISIFILTTYISLNALNPDLFTMFFGKYVMYVLIFINLGMDFYIGSELKKYNIKDYEAKIIKNIRIVLYGLFAIIGLLPMIVDTVNMFMRS
ncbi:helix-turn-helix domain-containing protein [Vagococcus carniphilus]|uniref:helix-turn-helix domain-containing protein n=1 Tax=Vagococcus carniphilus TaxID=218144 RepID=UPI003B5C0A83